MKLLGNWDGGTMEGYVRRWIYVINIHYINYEIQRITNAIKK